MFEGCEGWRSVGGEMTRWGMRGGGHGSNLPVEIRGKWEGNLDWV